MPRKKQLYSYPNGRKEMAFNVIDRSLEKYIPESYRNSLKAMVSDQINAKKYPQFIVQTMSDLIDYEIKNHYTENNIPDITLVTMKQNLVNALEGNK